MTVKNVLCRPSLLLLLLLLYAYLCICNSLYSPLSTIAHMSLVKDQRSQITAFCAFFNVRKIKPCIRMLIEFVSLWCINNRRDVKRAPESSRDENNRAWSTTSSYGRSQPAGETLLARAPKSVLPRGVCKMKLDGRSSDVSS